MAVGYFFTPGAIGGTVAVVVGITSIIIKNREDGRKWFAKKFGANWEKKVWIKFFGLPLIVVGIAMWFPDHFWIDTLKLVGGFITFIVGYIYWRKKKSAKKESATEKGDAATM